MVKSQDVKEFVEKMYKDTLSNPAIHGDTLILVMWMYIICKVLIALFYNTNYRYITNISVE